MTQHYLYLLRHAKTADRGPGETDMDRPLTEAGIQQCVNLARRLNGIFFDRILCSPAQRTRQTLAKSILRSHSADFHPELYQASAERLLRYLREEDEATETLLIVGHNPGLAEMAAMLGRLPGDFMSAGKLVLFNIPCAWREISPRACTVEDSFSP